MSDNPTQATTAAPVRSYAERGRDAMARALDYTDGAALAHALWWYLQARIWSAIDRADFNERDVVTVLQRDLEEATRRADPDPVWHLAVHTADAMDALTPRP